MAIVYKQCGGTQASKHYFCDPCSENVEHGGIRSVFLVKTNVDIGSLPEIEQALESGDLIVIPKSRGSFDGGSPKMGAGYGDQKERLLGYDFTANVKVPHYQENYEFWQWAEQQEWRFGFWTEKTAHLTEKTVTLNVKAPIEEDIETEIGWNVEVKWFDRKRPDISVFGSEGEAVKSLFKCFEVQ